MIFHDNKKIVMALGLILFVSCLGCSDTNDTGRTALSGKVTFDGKPVPYGLIYFTPDTTRGNQGPQGHAEIIDGQYRTDDGDAGVGTVTGPLVVQISGFSEGRGDNGIIKGTPIFHRYKTQIELSEGVSTMDFEVPKNYSKSSTPNSGRAL